MAVKPSGLVLLGEVKIENEVISIGTYIEAMREIQPELIGCYTAALDPDNCSSNTASEKVDCSPSGDVSVGFRIAPGGKADGFEIKPERLGQGAIGNCIREVLGGVLFPLAGDAPKPAVVSQELMFRLEVPR